MIAANTITAAHADALLKATPPEQRTDYAPPKPDEPKGDPLQEIFKLERKMSQVQKKYKRAEESYGSELLNLVVAKGYPKNVLENDAVRAYVDQNAPEILDQFELVLNTVSMEEAVEQAERGDGSVWDRVENTNAAEGASIRIAARGHARIEDYIIQKCRGILESLRVGSGWSEVGCAR